MLVLNGKTITMRDFTMSKPVTPGKAANSDAQLAPFAQRVIGALEETSLVALIDYLADHQSLPVALVQRQFCDRFNIGVLHALPAARFDAAVEYLVDQMPAEHITIKG